MALTLTARTPFGPNVRIALVTGASLALLGVVTIVLPVQRMSALSMPQSKIAETFPQPKITHTLNAATPAAEPAHDQLIAMTFDLLQALSKERIASGDETFTAPQAASPTIGSSTAPATRVVRTTSIRVAATPPPIIAAAPSPLIAPPEPIPEATAVASELDVGLSTPPAESVTVAQTAATTVDADLRVVAGQGVNVRAGPGKSKDKLFALPGGAEVTISDNEKGWLNVTDAEGRSGWVYKDYLLTP